MTAVTTAPGTPEFSTDQVTARPPLDQRLPMRASFTERPLTTAGMGLGTRCQLIVHAGSVDLGEPLIEPGMTPDGHGRREPLNRGTQQGEALPRSAFVRTSVGAV